MGIDATSLANGVGVFVQNASFSPGAQVLQRKIGVVGTYDPTILTVANDAPVLITSAEDAGARFGFGFMLHKLCEAVFATNPGVPVYAIPQAEGGSATAGTAKFTLTGTATEDGYLYLYVGERIVVPVANGEAAADVIANIVAQVNANKRLMTTAASGTGEVTFTFKSKGLWGKANDSSTFVHSVNAIRGEVVPAGLTVATGAVSGGTVNPDMGDTLAAALGTGSSANALGITDLVHGYGFDTTVLTDISNYVGAGNTAIGLYSEIVAKPFRALAGYQSSTLSALITKTDLRLTDRANGVLYFGRTYTHAALGAAEAMALMAKVNNNTAEGSYSGLILSSVGIIDDGVSGTSDWNREYDDRDTAVQSGISPALQEGGVVKLSNVVSFYRPASVPVESNLYRSMRNISITQNILAATRAVFESDNWQGISIVSDVTKVSNPTSRLKARDIDSVKDALLALIKAWEGRAWIYDGAPSVESLKEAGAVTIRAGGTGFDSTVKVVYSGEGGILNTVVLADINIAAATA